MSEGREPTLIDRMVAHLARAMDSVGLNGRRVLWRWNQHKNKLGEARAQGEQVVRSARARHKMCPECRTLVERSATECTECGTSLSQVRTPGARRVATNLLPGISSAKALILLVNGIFFILMLMSAQSSGSGGSLFSSFPPMVTLRFGGGWGELIFRNGEWFRMVTSLFLHGGLLHFGMNSWVLLQLGSITEELYGSVRFWVIYLFAGLCGNVLAQAVPLMLRQAGVTRAAGAPVVGASGAIVGLIGLLLAYGIRRGGHIGNQLRSMMLQYALLILLIGFLPGISQSSHVGGFVGGFLAGLVVPPREGQHEKDALHWQVLALLGVLLVLASFYGVARHGSDFLKLL